MNARIQTLLLEGSSDPQLCAEAQGKERLLAKAVPNRSRRADAPRQPAGSATFSTPMLAADAFKEARAQTLQLAQTTTHELDNHVFPHFVFGQLNIYQWLLLLSLHCERHAAQIQEIKENPAFPLA